MSESNPIRTGQGPQQRSQVGNAPGTGLINGVPFLMTTAKAPPPQRVGNANANGGVPWIRGVLKPGDKGHVAPRLGFPAPKPPAPSLMTRSEMVKQMGRAPKTNIGLAFAPARHMSTRYKNTLDSLDAFHHASNSDKLSRLALLDKVEQSNNAYLAKHPTSPVGTTLKTQITQVRTLLLEGSVNDTMAKIDAFNKTGMRPVGTTDTERQSQKAQLTALLNDAEKSNEALRAQFPDLLSARSLADQISATRKALDVLTDKTINWGAVNGGHGITQQQAVELSRLGMKPGPETRFDPEHTDAKLTNLDKKFGNGVVNTVAKATYQNGDVRVLKPETGRRGAEIDQGMGIPEHNPAYAARNLATKVVDEVLQTGLLGPTTLALHEGRLHTAMGLAEGVQGRGKTALRVLDRANPADAKTFMALDVVNKVKSPDIWKDALASQGVNEQVIDAKTSVLSKTEHHPYSELDFRDPALLQSLNKLEWLDHITGQADRHGGNYLIALDQHKMFKDLKAIDNDSSFGKDCANMTNVKQFNQQYKGVGLPLVIDKALATKILDPATWPAIEGRLKGLITDQELSATKARYDEGVAHIKTLAATGVKVVDDWSNTNVYVGDSTLQNHVIENPANSYAAREFHQQRNADAFSKLPK